MNKILRLAIGVAFGGLATVSTFAAGSGVCSLTTLKGTYAFGGVAETNGVPHSSSGMEAYDGQGNLKYYELWSDGSTQHTYTGTGTYTITANCIATVTYDGSSTDVWTYFVAPKGNVFFYNNNLGLGGVGGGREERIAWTLLLQ